MKKLLSFFIILTIIIIGFLKKEEQKVFEISEHTMISIYLDDQKVKSIPSKVDNYYFDEKKSICTNNTTITWDYDTWSPHLKNLTLTKTKCFLYFRKITEKIGTEAKFSYKNAAQVFKPTNPGFYKIELWGAASGEDDESKSGYGAYTSGIIVLKMDQELYIYTGEKGSFSQNYGDKVPSSFNGGGSHPGEGNIGLKVGSGGGATDIRLIKSEWNDFDSLKSRIMVAAGGGAGLHSDSQSTSGAAGGGLIGYNGIVMEMNNEYFISHSAPQGGSQSLGGNESSNFYYLGSFGSAGPTGGSSSGGGGGYYGGEGGYDVSWSPSGGGGGSSFISGHQGCNAIATNSTISNIIHTNQPIHYSKMSFKDTVIIDGEGYLWKTEKQKFTGMPTFDGITTMKGNNNAGYAKITYLGVNS